jgi:hypothetical protein
MCSIGYFHWAEVVIKNKGRRVELWMEGKTRIVIEDAVVLYAPAEKAHETPPPAEEKNA